MVIAIALLLPTISLASSITMHFHYIPDGIDIGYYGNWSYIINTTPPSGIEQQLESPELYPGDSYNFTPFFTQEMDATYNVSLLNFTLYLRNRYGDLLSPVIYIFCYIFDYDPLTGEEKFVGKTTNVTMGYLQRKGVKEKILWLAKNFTIAKGHRLKVIISAYASEEGGPSYDIIYFHYDDYDVDSRLRMEYSMTKLIVNVTTDKKSYSYGENITIYGKITDILGNPIESNLTLLFYGKSLLKRIDLRTNGTFTINVTADFEYYGNVTLIANASSKNFIPGNSSLVFFYSTEPFIRIFIPDELWYTGGYVNVTIEEMDPLNNITDIRLRIDPNTPEIEDDMVMWVTEGNYSIKIEDHPGIWRAIAQGYDANGTLINETKEYFYVRKVIRSDLERSIRGIPLKYYSDVPRNISIDILVEGDSFNLSVKSSNSFIYRYYLVEKGSRYAHVDALLYEGYSWINLTWEIPHVTLESLSETPDYWLAIIYNPAMEPQEALIKLNVPSNRVAYIIDEDGKRYDFWDDIKFRANFLAKERKKFYMTKVKEIIKPIPGGVPVIRIEEKPKPVNVTRVMNVTVPLVERIKKDYIEGRIGFFDALRELRKEVGLLKAILLLILWKLIY